MTRKNDDLSRLVKREKFTWQIVERSILKSTWTKSKIQGKIFPSNIWQKYGIYRRKNMSMVAVKNEIMHRGQSDPDLQKISKKLCSQASHLWCKYLPNISIPWKPRKSCEVIFFHKTLNSSQIFHAHSSFSMLKLLFIQELLLLQFNCFPNTCQKWKKFPNILHLY